MRLFSRPQIDTGLKSSYGRMKPIEEDVIQEIDNNVYGLGNGKQRNPDHKLKTASPLGGSVSAVNTTKAPYYCSLEGVAGAHLWTIPMNALPGQKKRYLSVLGATTFLVNYGDAAFPSKINLLLSQVAPSVDKQGNPSHIIAALVPQGPAIPVQNSGGIVGYNISYGLLNAPESIDITGIPVLTFDISINDETVHVEYPILEPIVLSLVVTHVAL